MNKCPQVGDGFMAPGFGSIDIILKVVKENKKCYTLTLRANDTPVPFNWTTVK